MALPLRFHWHPCAEDLLEADKLAAVSQYAEECGFESVVVPDALVSEAFLTSLSAAAKVAQKIKFLLQCEANSAPKRDLLRRVSPSLELLGVRASVYVPFDQDGKPFCEEADAEEYYSSIGEFFRECNALHGPKPEIFVEGVSAEAVELAIKFADCLWLKPKRVEQIYSDALPVLHMGKEVGIRSVLIARETAEKAYAVAAKLFPGGRTKDEETSESGACLWLGVPSPQCPDGIALTGSFAEVAEMLMRYKEKGISQFLFSAPPGEPVMTYFAADVLPIVQKLEADSNHAMEVAG